MDTFGVCFLIGVGGFILFRIVRNSIKNDNIETVKRYRDQYPHAYREYYPHDSLSSWDLSSMSYSELSDRASLSEYALRNREQAIKDEEARKRREEYEKRKKEEEARRQARLEAERKQREIDSKYDVIATLYPNGLRRYKRENPSRTSKESIISVSKDVFKNYEAQYKEYDSYLSWQKEQQSFAMECRDLRDTHLSDWGCYTYNAAINGVDEYGKPKKFDFKLWQLFYGSFCLADDIDYKYYTEKRDNRKYVPKLIDGTSSYEDSVYDKIIPFLQAINGPLIVILNDSNIGAQWDSVSELHFSHIREELKEKSLPFIEINEARQKDKIRQKTIVVIDLITKNSCLVDTCSLLLSKSNKSRIVYITLYKEFDGQEIVELNEKRIKEEREREAAARREQEERERRAQREREEAERRAREAEERRQREEAARRAREERARLNTQAHTQKANAWEFRNYLTSNGIRYLYHFTDRRNLDSIRRNGGLYSWYYCENHDISIPYPGGGEQSRNLDRWHGLQDYVRLSFCDDHPMAYRLKQDGYNLVLLRIKIDVALLEETLFSDINAADGAHHHGRTMDDLRRVDLSATQQHYVSSSSPIFKKHQAEVLVKTFIPLEYIENIDNPMSM